MEKHNDQTQETENPVIIGGGIGGTVVVPADGSIFGPDPEPAPDERGVNEDDVSAEDDGLMDSGESPEFDHSRHPHRTNRGPRP